MESEDLNTNGRSNLGSQSKPRWPRSGMLLHSLTDRMKARKRNILPSSRTAGLLVLSLIALPLLPAFAQTGGNTTAAPTIPKTTSPNTTANVKTAPPPHAAASPAPEGIEEITVTAQKREQLSKDVPIALTAINASNIEFRGIENMTDLAQQVPGMQYGFDSGNEQQIYIRGIGVDDSAASLEAPIATYINGVYQTRTFRTDTLGLDLDRVEVLKGPQGTLFGRNATGGLINIIMKKPADELEGAVKVGGGSYGQILGEGRASGPLIKGLLDVGIAYSVQKDQGWVENRVTDRYINDHLNNSGRLAFSLHPLENLSIDYDLFLSKEVGAGVNAITTIAYQGTPAQQKAALGLVLPRNSYLTGLNPWSVKLDSRDAGDQENSQNDATIKWDFADWGYLKSITAFQEHALSATFDSDGTSFPLITFYPPRKDDDKTFTQELNLGGTNEWLTWITGAYYMHENYSTSFDYHIAYFPATPPFNKTDQTLTARGRETTNSLSGFGDTTIPLPKHFSLFGGVRYTYDRKATTQTVNLAFGPPITGPLASALGFCDGLKTIDNFHNILYRVGMGWEPTEQLNVYVKYSRGYNAGGQYYNGCNDAYKPEHLGTIEGGVKGRFFNGRLVVDAAGYWNHFTDFQVYKNLPTSSEVVNAPEAEMWGGEFQVTALPVENVQADVGISVMHSQYDKFSDFDVLKTYSLTGPNGVATLLPHTFENLAGHQMERAPNKTINVGLEYDAPIPWHSVIGDRAQGFLNLGSLRLRGEWYWSDFVIFRVYDLGGAPGSNFNRQNPYSIFNLYATLPTEDNKWSLRVFAKNFTSTKYIDYSTAEPWGQIFTVGGLPQWFGADLTYRF